MVLLTLSKSKLVDLNTRSTDIHMLDKKKPTPLVRHVGFISRQCRLARERSTQAQCAAIRLAHTAVFCCSRPYLTLRSVTLVYRTRSRSSSPLTPYADADTRPPPVAESSRQPPRPLPSRRGADQPYPHLPSSVSLPHLPNQPTAIKPAPPPVARREPLHSSHFHRLPPPSPARGGSC